MQKIICICGAGTMGYGIAQVFALRNFKTILFDVNADQLNVAKKMIYSNLDHLVTKEKISTLHAEEAKKNLTLTTTISDCKADIIIEAIVENVTIKSALYKQLEAVIEPKAIIVSNTSSLSINLLQVQLEYPARFAGLHFFNPAPVMKLVEVIKGEETKEDVINELVALCNTLAKTPVVCNDSPGFIVNRVARHYYLEAMYIADKESVSIEDVDAIMQATGFKLGPFQLMDLIGVDINLSVTESLYKAFDNIKRFEPSAIQIDKVRQGNLGKKTGKGFYDYNPKQV
jgi:3-hydroxybutyryl-CoA dehydrogenase